jgi:hypothetical protein
VPDVDAVEADVDTATVPEVKSLTCDRVIAEPETATTVPELKLLICERVSDSKV